MAEERVEFEIVVNVKAKLEIWQNCEFVKVKDEVSKTKIACRHCQIELKYSGNISNFSDNLTRKHSAVSLLFFVTSIFSFSYNQIMRKTYKENKMTWKKDRCKKRENPLQNICQFDNVRSDARHTLFLAETMT